jgi:hypothetical protein
MDLLAAVLSLALAPAAAQDANDACLACHSDAALTLALPTGQVRSMTVDGAAFAASVHGSRLACTDCHPGHQDYPHPERTYKTLAEYRAPFREACKSCHFENYTRMVDSVHYKLLPQGDPRAPTCSDCHGAHDVKPPGQPRAALSQTCAQCHRGVYDTYAKSVHGQALLAHQSPDVPVCTDCHRSHAVGGPHDAAWLLQSPQLCGSCHADEKKMAPYGLSTRVLKTYLADFHGMSASLSRAQRPQEARLTALCTDCHGVHDIARVDDPGSRVVKANLVKTCRRCHPGATDSFPAAWLSHYEPSLKTAPLVFMVQAFYWVFIPFVIGGLVLQIVLHFWRLVVNR